MVFVRGTPGNEAKVIDRVWAKGKYLSQQRPDDKSHTVEVFIDTCEAVHASVLPTI